ncbi:MAG: Cof-type HAD-IIB family hydrolase [Clostridia bacterium]|nr:Cof-type HAD-IIB family hydrolase [Clostridia bacterium]
MGKIIFFDIDGTIVTDVVVDSERVIPESCVRAIGEARKRGHLCFINSGRPYGNIDKDVLEIGFDGVASGCGTNIRIGNDEIFCATVEKSICRHILEMCKKCRMNGFFERKDTNFFTSNGPDGGWIIDFMESVKRNGGTVSMDTESEDFSFDKMCVFSDAGSDIKAFLNAAAEHFSIIDREKGFYELVPKGCSKGNAIKMIAERLGVPISDTYVLGDSENDIEMFNATPNSIGMGNGKSIHNCVSFVTRDILDNGVEFALKHFGLID